jgi:hypothetical protein
VEKNGSHSEMRISGCDTAKGRGPVVGGSGNPMGGKMGVGRLGWKERWAAVGPNPERGQNSKINSFRISIDFRIWQNFGKLYKEI